MKKSSRRNFLVVSGKAISATMLGSLLLDADLALGAVPIVRRNVVSMTANDPILLSYRRAIRAMQALPQNNPLSWTYQAAIHRTMLGPPFLTSWNTCEHGTEFFWSWHRMYLYWFERIVRKFCEEPCWALPYWNWAPGSDFQLPAPFRDTASELYTANRNSLINNGTASLNPAAVSVVGSFSLTSFVTTNLNIQGPHGSVHVQVGGWMSDPATAAQDPVFYVHHSNVDRLWNLWLAQGGGRSDPVLDTTWTGQQYTFFDENGAAVQMTACEILRAAQQLNYVYEGEPPQVIEFCRRRLPFPWWQYETVVLFQLPGPPVELKGETVSVHIDIKELRGKLMAALERKNNTLLLKLDEVEAEQQPGVSWAVYAGLPAGSQPKAEGPHYVGTLALFGTGIRGEKHHEHKPAQFVFPLNEAVAATLKANEEEMSITFVPLGILVEGKPTRPEVKSPVRIGKMSFAVEKASQGKQD